MIANLIEHDPGLVTHTIYRPRELTTAARSASSPSRGSSGSCSATSAAGRGYFVAQDCGICKDASWQVNSRALP